MFSNFRAFMAALYLLHVYGYTTDLCYNRNLEVCNADGFDVECPDKKIFLTAVNAFHNPSPCDDFLLCYTSSLKTVKENSTYELELHRRCSAQSTCNVTHIEQTEQTSVEIGFDCLDLVELDPCHSQSVKMESDFTIKLSDNTENYNSCSCAITPREDVSVTLTMVDVRPGPEKDICKNSITVGDGLGNIWSEYNCSNTPIFNEDSVVKEFKDNTFFININLGDSNNPPELIWLRITQQSYLFNSTHDTTVTCTHVANDSVPTAVTTSETTLEQSSTSSVYHTSTFVDTHPSTDVTMVTDDVTKASIAGEDSPGDYSTIAIAVSVVLITGVVVGVCAFILYKRRRKSKSSEPDFDLENDMYISVGGSRTLTDATHTKTVSYINTHINTTFDDTDIAEVDKDTPQYEQIDSGYGPALHRSSDMDSSIYTV